LAPSFVFFFGQIFTTWGKLYNPMQLKQELCGKNASKLRDFKEIFFNYHI
jgi:hypothetical protein